jgi:hypothetical protein
MQAKYILFILILVMAGIIIHDHTRSTDTSDQPQPLPDAPKATPGAPEPVVRNNSSTVVKSVE